MRKSPGNRSPGNDGSNPSKLSMSDPNESQPERQAMHGFGIGGLHLRRASLPMRLAEACLVLPTRIRGLPTRIRGLLISCTYKIAAGATPLVVRRRCTWQLTDISKKKGPRKTTTLSVSCLIRSPTFDVKVSGYLFLQATTPPWLHLQQLRRYPRMLLQPLELPLPSLLALRP